MVSRDFQLIYIKSHIEREREKGQDRRIRSRYFSVCLLRETHASVINHAKLVHAKRSYATERREGEKKRARLYFRFLHQFIPDCPANSQRYAAIMVRANIYNRPEDDAAEVLHESTRVLSTEMILPSPPPPLL